MADRGTHWLAFSNSDQQILTERTQGELWDALVVPGTLATYYMQGVGGYVLATRRPFVIDPRTPLIQPAFDEDRPRPPKASHKTLAKIHHPDLLHGLEPEARELAESRMRVINDAYSSLKRQTS